MRTLKRRVSRLSKLAADLHCWSIRDAVRAEGWETPSGPLRTGGGWFRGPALHDITCPDITVPADWSLSDTRLELAPGGHGKITLLGSNGVEYVRPVGQRHLRFALPDRRLSAHLKLAPLRASSGHLTPEARWSARLIHLDTDVLRLCRLLLLVADLTRFLGGEGEGEGDGGGDGGGGERGGHRHDGPLALRLVEAAEAALARLRWPSASAEVVGRLAGREKLGKLWNAVGFDPVAPPLSPAASASVTAATGELLAELASLQAGRELPGSVMLLGYAHTDLAWLWPEAVTREAVDGQFGAAVHQLTAHPEFHFGQSSAGVYEAVERRAPALFDRVRAHVASGRWELLGGMWTEPDVNLPSGESLVRQLLHGQRYFQSRFGRRATVGWFPDSFGFPATLPQILAGAGIHSFYTTKLRLQEVHDFPLTLFRWEGADGTAVTAYSSAGSHGYQGAPQPAVVFDAWNHQGQRDLYPLALQLLGHDGAVGPTDEDIETAELLARLPGTPDTAFGAASDFFTGVREKIDAGEMPVHRGELYLEAHRGTYTAQGRTKSAGRDAEWSLITAEVLQSLHALVGGSPVPETDDWRTVLDCQAHDVITGVSIAEVHTDAETRLRDIAARAHERQLTTTRLLAGAVAPRGETPGIAVANPTLSARPLRLRLPADWNIGQRVGPDTRVLTAPDPLPPLSVSWRAPAAEVPAPATATSTDAGVVLENSEVRLLVGASGGIDQLRDKRTGRQVLSGPGNVVTAWLDRPHFWDAWELSAEYRGCPLEDLVCESVETVESGPHRAAVRIRHRFRDSTVVREIRLWAGSARVDVHTEIDWHERRVALRVAFPVPAEYADALFECPYGVVHRPMSSESADSDAQFEVPGQRFAAVASADGGLALLNNGRYGHRIRHGELSLTLLRSPVFPDPSCDEGRQSVDYALLPYRGGWLEGGVLAEAEDLNAPLVAERWPLDEPGTWQALDSSGLPLGLGAFKPAEDGDGLVLRVYEPAGHPGTARIEPPEGWRIHEELDLLEDSAGVPGFDFRPHQIRSWRLLPEREAR